MKGAKALIFPSLWYETAGLTILEAKSLGIPSLVKNTTAGSEFVSSQWIYNDEEMLKNKILNIDDLYNDIDRDMSKFSFEEYINNLKKYYERS